MPKPKIFVVEDDAIIVMTITHILLSKNYIVIDSAPSGEEALEKIKKLRPDLIFMDIILEGKMDGIETVKKIKKIYDVPIIYITAHSDEHTVNRAKKTKPQGYILKPFNNLDIYSAMDKLFSTDKNTTLSIF